METAKQDETEGFGVIPFLSDDQPGFKYVLDLMKQTERFAFCKINHGFWERLARLEGLGIPRDKIVGSRGKHIDELLGVGGSMFAEGGMLRDLLGFIKTAPSPENGMNFVATLTPWPAADRIEGTPLENRAQCDALIAHFVPQAHRDNVITRGFTGHEFKVAAITGGLRDFNDALQGRDVIFIGNDSNRKLIDALNLPFLTTIIVDAMQARQKRDAILQRLFKVLDAHQRADRFPLVVGAAGGSLTTWLAFNAWTKFERFQFVDLGGTLAAFSSKTAMRLNWTIAYGQQLAAALPKLNVSVPDVEAIYNKPFGLRDPNLVDIAIAAGVPAPVSNIELVAPQSPEPIQFIENKMYDHQRMAELLSLSIAANHHANGGPVTSLLEEMVAHLAKLPAFRRVIAINNGTAALHLACGLHAYRANRPTFRWVASAFNFFSCQVGPLSETQIIDCDTNGRFNLGALKAMPLDSYDGIIYTNIFAQHTDWDDVVEYCKINGKSLVIDNATGLLDRPKSSLTKNAPIETVSAHHTKPWGVGEGGFVICNADEETTIRKLLNFGVRLPNSANFAASNFKLSDLAASAIIDRLERMPHWAKVYRWQERRMRSLMIDLDLDVRLFSSATKPKSPRAHTPFICNVPVDVDIAKGPVVLRKYYRPVAPNKLKTGQTPNAEYLFDHIFSLSNAPEMRIASNEGIIAQVKAMIESSRADT